MQIANLCTLNLQVWVWEYPAEDDEGQPSSHDLFMDPGEEIRFRVTGETFVDCSPNAPDPSKPNQLDQVRKEDLTRTY